MRRVTVILCLLAAYLYLFIIIVRQFIPAALEYVGSELRERYGVALNDVKDPGLSLDRLTLRSGRIVIDRPQLFAELKFSNLSADFDLAALFSGRAGEIRADAVDLNLDLKKQSISSGASIPAVRSALSVPDGAQPTRPLPFKSLSIDKIAVKISGIDGVNELKLKGSGQLLPLSNGRLAVKLKGLTGEVREKFLLTDAQGSFEIDPIGDLAVYNATLRAASLETVLPVGEPVVRFSFSRKILKLVEAQGKILEGNFSIAPAEIDLNSAATNKITVELNELSIPAILALYPNEKVRGEGRVNAILPLTISPNGVSAQNGSFTSVGPGTIRTDLGSDTGPATLKIATQALENLHFETLGGRANLAESGVLELAVSMSGYNPDLNKDQPFNVNITVEENLKSLYKTLSVSRRITDSISGRAGN